MKNLVTNTFAMEIFVLVWDTSQESLHYFTSIGIVLSKFVKNVAGCEDAFEGLKKK